jgi:hypothetical protein
MGKLIRYRDYLFVSAYYGLKNTAYYGQKCRRLLWTVVFAYCGRLSSPIVDINYKIS